MKKIVKSKVIRTGAVYIVSSVMIKGIAFLTMPIFTRILSISDYGIYNTYIAYEGIINILYAIGAVFAIRNARFEYESDFETFKKSLMDLEFTLFICSLIIICLLKEPLSVLLGLDPSLVLCLSFHSFGSALIVLFTQMFQINYQTKRVVVLSLITTTINIALSLVLINYIFVEKRYIGRILGSSIAPILFLMLVAIIYLHKKKKFLETKYWRYILHIGLPALPTIIAENLIIQSDRIMIDRMSGDYEAGIYGTISSVGMILTVILNGVISAIVPWFYRKIQAKSTMEIVNSMDYSFLLAGFLSAGFGMIGPEIVKVFTAKPDYWNNSNLVILFSIMNIYKFGSVELATFEQYYKKNVFSSIGVGASCIINIALNYLMVPLLGYRIAAVTSISAMLINFIYHIIVTKLLNYNYYRLSNLLIICAFFTSLLVIDYLTCDLLLLRYAINITVLSIFAAYAYLNREKIKRSIKGDR